MEGWKNSGGEMKGLLTIKSVRDFKNALEGNGFKKDGNGFMVMGDGKSTGVKYRDVLNDFGRNISSSKSYRFEFVEKGGF